jgi:tRNA wybutosine-synthesizing protein 3
MSDFDQKKKHILQEIGLNSETNPDASPKGTIDSLCIPLITLINSHRDMVTTSSCSGRLSVFLEGAKSLNDTLTYENTDGNREKIKIGAKGDGGHWLFVSHEKQEIIEWWKNEGLKFKYETDIKDDNYDTKTSYVLFKYEPLILHVKCRDFKSASRLYSTAMGCGFRESGIGANNNVAIRISIKLDIPIGYMDKHGETVFVVNESYIKMITKLAYDRFLENERKLEQLYDRINREIIQYVEKSEEKETKEERKQRKIQEGLSRRDDVRKLKEETRRLKQLELEQNALKDQNGN